MKDRWYNDERGEAWVWGGVAMGAIAAYGMWLYVKAIENHCSDVFPEKYNQGVPSDVSQKKEDYRYIVEMRDREGRKILGYTNQRPEVEQIGSDSWAVTVNSGIFFGGGDVCDKKDFGLKKTYLAEWKSPPLREYLFVERPSVTPTR